MKMLKQIVQSQLLALLLFSSASMQADDTEIYLGGNNNNSGIKPNVLFVLDTSSSMTNEDGTGITRLDRMKTALHQILDSANNINVGLMRFHREGGPVLYPIADIDADISTVEGAGASGTLVNSYISQSSDDAEEANTAVTLDSSQLEMTYLSGAAGTSTIEVRVSSTNDDAEEKASNGSMYLDSTDLELIKDSGDQLVGIRFQSVAIPAGSTINSAEIEFEIDEQKSDTTNLTIHGQLHANPGAFSSTSDDISVRTTTSNSAVWTSVPNLTVNSKLTTPSLTAIVQEIVDQGGWASNNAMVFIITGSGKKTVESYDGESSAAPLLRVEYTTAAATPADQTVGLRFQSIDVPQGATITSATLEFQAQGSESGTTSLTIYGEDEDDTSTFSTASSDISSRTQTTASVSWTPGAWTDGANYQSPDLTAVVQEIVNRSGWCGGNSMTFLIEGTGLRKAKSYDVSATNAPLLSIDYDESSVSAGDCINASLQRQIAAGNDDAEEASDGTMDLTSTDLEMVEESTTQTVGLRFKNIDIPQSATILEASVTFIVDETNSTATSLTINGEKSGDAASFSSSSNNITGRPLTTAAVAWSPGSWSTIGESHETPDIKTVIQEVVNQGTWASGNALALIISGSGKRVADSYDGEPINSAVLKVKIQGQLGSGSKTVRSRLKDIVDEINWKSGTPIVDTLYEAALYYRGDDVFYGKTRGNSANAGTSLDRSEYTRLSHTASYTGGSIVRTGSCTEDNQNHVDCKTEYISGTATYESPISESCQANHIILLSDGYPSVNTSESLVETMIPGTCAGSGSGKCGVELLDHLYTTDQIAEAIHTGDQTIKTYTIGFEILASGKAYLEDLAAAGGGQFYEASTSADLVNAFQDIISDILVRPTSFSAPALTVNAFNKLYHNNEVYFSLFLPSDTKRWDGNVKKFAVCEGNPGDSCSKGEIIDVNDALAIGSNSRIKTTAQSYWSSGIDGVEVTVGGAGDEVPAYGSRRVFTYTGSTAPSDVTLNVASHKVEIANTALSKTLLGDAAMSDADREEVINWIRGKDVKDQDEDGAVDDDRWVFTDPLHGGSVSITYGYKHTGSGATIAPVLDANSNIIPITKLLIGSNDGTLRMINSDSGIEEWAFIPQTLLANQQDLMNNASGDHVYGLDNSATYRFYDANGNGIIEPTGTDIDLDGTVEDEEKDYVHAYISMRRGGRNIYALDVTPTSTITEPTSTTTISPKLLWRIEGGSGDYTKLGQTWSKPQVVKMWVKSGSDSYRKDVLIFAGGYHTDQDSSFGVSGYGNAIFVVDADDGSLIWSASDSGADLNFTDMVYPIPSDLAALDSDGTGVVDRIYFGDMGGQVWRIDFIKSFSLTGSNSSVAEGGILAKVSDSSDINKQRKFFYPPDVAQVDDSVFSSTALYDLIVIASGNRANPLNTDVHDRIYAFRDYRVRTKSDDASDTEPVVPVIPIRDNSIAIDEDNDGTADENLFDATENLIQQGDATEVAAAKTDLIDKKGWFIDLKEYDGSWIGEKSLATPLIVGGKLFYTTYVPGLASADPCDVQVEGGGRVYAVNMLTGAAEFNWYTGDANAATDLTEEDRRQGLGSGIPSEAIAIFQPTGVSVLVGSGGGATTIDPDVGLPKSRTFWSQDSIE